MNAEPLPFRPLRPRDGPPHSIDPLGRLVLDLSVRGRIVKQNPVVEPVAETLKRQHSPFGSGLAGAAELCGREPTGW